MTLSTPEAARAVLSPCYVQRIGTAVPETSLTPDESADLLGHACISPRGARLLQRIAKLTGIQRRYIVALKHGAINGNENPVFFPSTVQPAGPGMGQRTELFEKESGPLVLRALNAFPADELKQVGSLITISCTHASSPGLERPIFANTPVPPNVSRWNLGFMGCSAGLAGVRLALQTAASGRNALIVACELSSLHIQYTDELDQMTANVLFSDGAAAVTLGPRPTAARVLDARSIAVPQFADQMVWFAADTGLRLRLSQDLPDTLAAHLPAAIHDFLHANRLALGDIKHWLVHPGGPQILDAVERALALEPDALRHSRDVFREYGNMSSPTILFIMKRLLAEGGKGPALAMAFGPGLTIELVLLTLDGSLAT